MGESSCFHGHHEQNTIIEGWNQLGESGEWWSGIGEQPLGSRYSVAGADSRWRFQGAGLCRGGTSRSTLRAVSAQIRSGIRELKYKELEIRCRPGSGCESMEFIEINADHSPRLVIIDYNQIIIHLFHRSYR